MAWTLRQHTNVTQTTATTIALAYVSTVTAGSLLVAVACTNTGAPASNPSLSDNVNGNWTEQVRQAVGAGSTTQAVVGHRFSAASGTTTVSFTPNAGATAAALIIAEYGPPTGGAQSAVTSAQAGAGNTTATTSDSTATSLSAAAGDLAIGGVALSGAVTISALTAGSGYVLEDSVIFGGNARAIALEDILTTAATTQDAVLTWTGLVFWTTGVAVYTAAPTSAPGLPGLLSFSPPSFGRPGV